MVVASVSHAYISYVAVADYVKGLMMRDSWPLMVYFFITMVVVVVIAVGLG